MNNRKGFTLIELLVTITIIGIIMIMTLPAIHNLQRENQKKKFDDYERAVLEAAKAYEDQYEEDLFGRSDTGCASINYEDLVNKKLLTTTKIAGYECNNDKNGIIIRKVKGTSYYEVYLTCNKGTNDIKNLTGNNDDFNNIKSNHCNTGEDHDPPILTIKCDGDNDNTPAHGAQGDDFQTTHIYYYSTTNDGEKRIPELTVQASDNITGLEKNQYVTYEWKIYNAAENILNNIPNKIEKNKTTFNTKDGAGSTSKKKVRIIEEFKRVNTTGKAVVDLSGDNIIDRAGNKLSLEADSATETCQYFYDNAKPHMEIRITGNNTGTSYDTNSEYWINEPITTTVTVTDVTGNGIYSGIEPSSLTRGNVNEQLTGGMETYTFTKEDSNRKEDDEYKVCDKVGNCTSQTVKIRVDTTPPTCGQSSSSESDPWTNQTRTVTVECIDDLSKCKRKQFQQSFGNDSATGTITIEDNARNTTNCTVVTKVDKTKPVCTSSGGDIGWRKDPLTIKGTCTDNLSGCVKTTYTKQYSGNTNILNGFGGRACDVAGNCDDCSKDQEVHIDTTPPTCEFVVTNENVPGKHVDVAYHCYDNYAITECDRWIEGGEIYHHGNTNTHVSEALVDYPTGENSKHVKDAAGNTARCTLNIVESTCSKCPETCCPYGLHRSGDLCCAATSFYCLGLQTCYTGTCTSGQYCGYHAS